MLLPLSLLLFHLFLCVVCLPPSPLCSLSDPVSRWDSIEGVSFAVRMESRQGQPLLEPQAAFSLVPVTVPRRVYIWDVAATISLVPVPAQGHVMDDMILGRATSEIQLFLPVSDYGCIKAASMFRLGHIKNVASAALCALVPALTSAPSFGSTSTWGPASFAGLLSRPPHVYCSSLAPCLTSRGGLTLGF